ncbi:MAG: arginine deiminase-related protein, partial [Bacteriovoracaceae bacterium]
MSSKRSFASSLLMVRPLKFGANESTMLDNAFQKKSPLTNEEVSQKALAEFDGFARKLTEAGLKIHVVQDQMGERAPDSVFPNNWFSTHPDGNVFLYPMKAPNRRLERRNPVIEELKRNFKVQEVLDLSRHEDSNRFLEGTGSIVFDHKNRLAFAAISERTDKALFLEHCKRLEYEPICFDAADESGNSVYHTNVMLAVADKFAIACLDMIPDLREKERLKDAISNGGKSLIDVSYHQALKFCCNCLQASSEDFKEKLTLAMSQQAWEAFTPAQKELILDSSVPVVSPLYTIEAAGGGGAR